MSGGSFWQGVIYAAGYLCKWQGQDTVARNLLREAGYTTWKEILKSRPDEYDLKNLENIREELGG